MDKITRNASRTSDKKPKPIVDVPKSDGSEDKISQFIELNRAAVTKFMDKQFEGIGKKEISEVLRECAECSVLTRSPKSGGCWGSETDIIEDALKVCKPLATKPVDDEEDDEELEDIESDDEIEEDDEEEADEDEEDSDGDEDQDETEEEGEESDLDDSEDDAHADEDEEVEDDEEEEAVKPVQKSPRKTETKKPAKVAKTKTTTKTTKSAKAKTVETKDKKAKKTQTESSVTIKTGNDKIDKILNTNSFSEEDLKGLKGLELWIGAARYLKLKSKLRCQLQDMPEVIGHLYDVHRGKAKLNESGFQGKGVKSYRKKRMLNFLGAIKELIGES